MDHDEVINKFYVITCDRTRCRWFLLVTLKIYWSKLLLQVLIDPNEPGTESRM